MYHAGFMLAFDCYMVIFTVVLTVLLIGWHVMIMVIVVVVFLIGLGLLAAYLMFMK